MKKPKEQNLKLETLKGMLEYHKENPKKKTLVAKLEQRINSIETQEKAKQRELNCVPSVETGSYKVVNLSTKERCYCGTLRNCTIYLNREANIDLTIQRNK